MLLPPSASTPALCLLFVLLMSGTASAADTWTTPYPGIDYLHRVDAGQVVHAIQIDISRPEMAVRVTREGEGPATPSAAAALLGATVLINGDWSVAGNTRPFGLSVGHGWQWTDAIDPPNGTNSPHDWLFLACTTEKDCFFDDPQSQRPWLRWAWQNVVGGNEAVLIQDGTVHHPSGGDTFDDRHPRSAVGLNSTATIMTLVVVQGRRSDSLGMSFGEVADLMDGLGCHDAMMLDGGGSSGLVLDGTRLNDRPTSEPAERTVVNHLAIIRTPIFDTACASIPNGRYCTGETLNYCHGGQHDSGDCAFAGLTCEEGLGTAYCVDPACTNGGNNNVCVSSDVIGLCQWGQYDTVDCSGLWGASCEEGGGSAYCVDPRCIHGGNDNWCSGDLAEQCVDGAYSTEDCAATGEECDSGVCVDAGDDDDTTSDDDDSPSDDDDSAGDDDDSAGDDDDSAGDDDDAVGDADTADDDDDMVGDDDDTSLRPETGAWECACDQIAGEPRLPLLPLLLLMVFGLRRHRMSGSSRSTE